MESNKNRNDVFPRTLIISCNCFHTGSSNGKTILRQFSSWPSENLAQFYTYPELPDNARCGHYFRITDKDLLKFRMKKELDCGQIIQTQNKKMVTSQHVMSAFGLISKWSIARLARDIIWLGRSWRERGLETWIRDFRPEAVYFMGLNNPYLFRLAYDVASEYNIPVLIFVTDDYYHGRVTMSPSFWIRNYWLKASMRKLLALPRSKMFTINEIMAQDYKRLFGTESGLLVNNVEVPHDMPVSGETNDKIIISYIGNLLHNRWKTIGRLAEVIADSQYRDKIEVHVYCQDKPKGRIQKVINKPPVCSWKGSLSSEEIGDVMRASDILLHVESFAYNDKRLAVLSFSTKLTEYMAAGRPILAIASEDVASTKILMKYNAAVVSTSLNADAILKALNVVMNENNRKEISCRAWHYINDLYARHDFDNELLDALRG